MFIEHAGKRILFDTGVSDAFADNAAKLGVDLASVDVAVISHHHFDHGGGLRHFMQLNTRAPIVMAERPRGASAGRHFHASGDGFRSLRSGGGLRITTPS